VTGHAAAGDGVPGEAVTEVSICDQPLSVDAVLRAVTQPGAGGTVLFVGTVRDHDGGRPVTALAYSAHPSALELMRAVVAEVAAEFPETHLAASHRVGDLRVGDVAVVVAAGAAHREQAFLATRELIDRIKARVPIWKHQSFADGTEEWVGSPG
jgi:molybdopterin synthase catalytic subunit